MLVRTHELEGAFRPVPSPDGRWLVYATRYDAREALKLLDLTNAEEHWLVMDVQRDDHQVADPAIATFIPVRPLRLIRGR